MAEILDVAWEHFKGHSIENNNVSVIWKHGHWWVTLFDENEERERLFDVVDVSNGNGDEFEFEEV